MKAWLLVVVGLTFLANPAWSQTTANPCDSPASFSQWFTCQQAQVGLAYGIKGRITRNGYLSTWWDAISYGQLGINVGKAGAADYTDIGVAVNTAPGQVTRYCAAVPLHVGNIWNNAKLPSSIAGHVHLSSVPDTTVAAEFCYPKNKPLKLWRWDTDFMPSLAYRFGGS